MGKSPFTSWKSGKSPPKYRNTLLMVHERNDVNFQHEGEKIS